MKIDLSHKGKQFGVLDVDLAKLELGESPPDAPPTEDPGPPIEPPATDNRLVTLGASIHHAFNPATWDRVNQIGLSSVRFGIQPHSDLDRCVEVIAMLSDMGIKVTVHLSAYRWNPNNPKVWPEFAKFCGQVAGRLIGFTNVILEIWNEANHKRFLPWVSFDGEPLHPWPQHYSMFAVECCKAIRGVNPDVPIISSGLAPEVPQGGVDFNYIEPMIAAHPILEHVDGFGIHPYRKHAERWEDPEKMIRNIRELQTLVAPLPLHSTEFGASAADRGVSAQAELVLRYVLVQLWLGIKDLNLYELTDTGPDPGNREHNYGLFTMDGRIKPAGVAIQYLLERTEGLPLTATGKDDNVFWLGFGGDLIIMWPYPGEYKPVTQVIDMYGNPTHETSVSTPIYAGNAA